MLASLATQPFNDPNWLFEIKWDGIRARAQCGFDPADPARVRLVSRTGRDLTAQYPELQRLPLNASAVLDGEIVALDPAGVSSFNRLQQRMNLADLAGIARAATAVPVDFYAFDLLALNGDDLTALPLAERKRRLAALPLTPPWRYSDHVAGDGAGLFAEARRQGLEGIIAKRADSTYRPGRSRDWLKFKFQRRQEAVIVGVTPPRGSRTGFGALLLAAYDPAARRFRYIGRVGTGFDAATRRDILDHLHHAPQPAIPPPPAAGAVRWVRPDQVAEIAFAEWTPAGRLRAPVFLGLRTDKAPRECVREESVA